MENKYGTLLEKLQRFKQTKQKEKPCTVTKPQSTIKGNVSIQEAGKNRRKTMAGSSILQQSSVGQKRKSLHPVTSKTASKKPKQEEDIDMRSKLEEWRKKKEQVTKPQVSNPERRRTFIPTGPYGVSFGIDMALSDLADSRKSLPASKLRLSPRKSMGTFMKPRISTMGTAQKPQSTIRNVEARKSFGVNKASTLSRGKDPIRAGNFSTLQNTASVKKGTAGSPKRQGTAAMSSKRKSISSSYKPIFDNARMLNSLQSKGRPSFARANPKKSPPKRPIVAQGNQRRHSTLNAAATRHQPTLKENRFKTTTTDSKAPTRILKSVKATPKAGSVKRVLAEEQKAFIDVNLADRVKKQNAEIKAQRVKNEVEEQKKKKAKFVSSRIDTGLSNIRRLPKTPAKNDAAEKVQKQKMDSRPAWNKTPRVDNVMSRVGISGLKSNVSSLAFGKVGVTKPDYKSSTTTQAKSQSTAAIPSKSRSTAAISSKSRSTIATSSKSQVASNRPKSASASKTMGKSVKVTPKRNSKRSSILKAQVESPKDGGMQHVRFAAAGEEKDTEKMTDDEQQHAMRLRLDNWLQAHGKTPSKYNTLRTFNKQMSAKKKVHRQSFVIPEENITGDQEEDAVTTKLDKLLSECQLLLQSGCPSGSVSVWLEEIVCDIPSAKQAAKYWICQAMIKEKQSLACGEVIDVYEEAVRQDVKNPDEIADALKDYLVRIQGSATLANDVPQTPQPSTPSSPPKTPTIRQRRSEVSAPDSLLKSSVIKYSMTQATTPFFQRLRSRASHAAGDVGFFPPAGSDPLLTPVHAVVTPVRRSTRRSSSRRPSLLDDHTTILEDLADLPDNMHVLMKKNVALNLSMDLEEEEEMDVEEEM